MPTSIDPAEIPPQFLNSLFLVGKVPWRASISDPRISYAMYIPETQYIQALQQGDQGKKRSKLPLLVAIHGSRRDVSPIQSTLIRFAQSTPCAILAPLFPAGLDGPEDVDSYKILRSKTLKSDLVLLSILDEVKSRWSGIETDKVYMMGFSGGGQFAQRFLYLYPERLLAVSIGAPGRVTSLSNDHAWPEGIANIKTLFDREIEMETLRSVQIQLIVGEDDDAVHGGPEFWNWLEEFKSKHKIATKGDLKPMTETRLVTARRLHAHWHEHGIEAQLHVVPLVKHVAEDVREHVLNFILSQMTAAEDLRI